VNGRSFVTDLDVSTGSFLDGVPVHSGRVPVELAPCPGPRRRRLNVRREGPGCLVTILAPLNRSLGTGTLIAFVLALAVVGAGVAWQVRAILASDVPRLRAIESVAVGLPMLLLVFASVYVSVETNRPNSFSEALSRTDALVAMTLSSRTRPRAEVAE
jgi:hypothetical protein